MLHWNKALWWVEIVVGLSEANQRPLFQDSSTLKFVYDIGSGHQSNKDNFHHNITLWWVWALLLVEKFRAANQNTSKIV